MNTSRAEAIALASELAGGRIPGVELVVCPPHPWLAAVHDILTRSAIRLGAQDCWPRPNGAFSGAVSIGMVAELCSHVIAGHSERRQWFGESDDLVREKVDAILGAGLTPILCVGESLSTRQSGNALGFVSEQVRAVISNRPPDAIGRVIVAYEPIWAIGTGIAASSEDAEEMARVIRDCIDDLSPGSSASVRILYGGSVNADNSREMLNRPGVDGALVGGASLNASSFLAIARSVAR